MVEKLRKQIQVLLCELVIVLLCIIKYDAKHLQATKDKKNYKTSKYIKSQNIYKQAKREYCKTSKQI
jgi:hypothetical protein